MDESIHVLLVDDQERFVQNTAKLLTSRAFHVITALSGPEALDRISAREDIDVIVMDVKMPGMDGVQALKAIKSLRPDIEIIMLTGHAALASGAEAIRSGAFDYLLKPCDIEDLAQIIRVAYDTERIRQQPVLWRRNCVREVLRLDFLRLPPSSDCSEAVAVLSKSAGAPASDNIFILDGENRLLGSVSRKQLLDAATAHRPGAVSSWDELSGAADLLKGLPVQAAWGPEPDIAAPAESITAVADRMLRRQLTRIAVMESDRMIGVACMRDVLMHIEREIE